MYKTTRSASHGLWGARGRVGWGARWEGAFARIGAQSPRAMLRLLQLRRGAGAPRRLVTDLRARESTLAPAWSSCAVCAAETATRIDGGGQCSSSFTTYFARENR